MGRRFSAAGGVVAGGRPVVVGVAVGHFDLLEGLLLFGIVVTFRAVNPEMLPCFSCVFSSDLWPPGYLGGPWSQGFIPPPAS